MMFRILALLLLPVICLAQVNSNGGKPTGELLSNEISPNEMKRNASFNLDEIKIRWKKAALENCAGVPCVSVVVPVFTIPGSPTNVTAVAGNTEATVSFTVPSSTGGSAITSYTVTSTPGGGIKSGTGPPLTVTGLTNGTPYTFTVIATNAVGSSVASAASAAVTPAPPPACGLVTSVTIDGYSYPTVSIGTQCWTKENLKVTKYNDGTPIDFDNSGGMDGISGGYNPNPWYTRSAGAFTIYANDGITGTNATNYGFLYNWFAAADPRKLCPAGWHVPTDPDWTTLIEFHGGIIGNIPTLFSASPKMKQKGTTLWNNPNNGTDDFGFTALPAGLRFGGTNQFADLKSNAYFWSATEGTLSGSLIWISSNGPVNFLTQIKTYGYSVRCLRD